MDLSKFGLSTEEKKLYIFVRRGGTNNNKCWYRLNSTENQDLANTEAIFLNEDKISGKVISLQISQQSYKDEENDKLTIHMLSPHGKEVAIRSGLHTIFSTKILLSLKEIRRNLMDEISIVVFPSKEDDSVVFSTVKVNCKSIQVNWEEKDVLDKYALVDELNDALKSFKLEAKDQSCIKESNA